VGRQRCPTFMVSGGLPSVRGDGDGREKRERKVLFENVELSSTRRSASSVDVS
jgi:hypothetical protein